MTLKTGARRWYKEPWPWILMAGPGLVIVAGIITVWLAVVSNDGLVTDDYYKQGLAVNQRLQRDHQAAALSLQADLMRSEDAIRLLVSATDSAAIPQEIVLKLAHPTQAGHDQSIVMKSLGQGFYEGRLTTSVVGRWHVTLEDPAGQWRLQGDWRADSGEPLRLQAKAG
ncbi:FixH family protein [Azonexus sp. R2A61]|uniref:FixH family protein n=1 Tax=Azonexus sp. R2A61 TaxID=2744443 RepID=UPI001F256F2D|nr:FixH family protein [Azonexus sp. R2A61]